MAVVPVKVKAKGREAVVETYAFPGPGSNTSFCTDHLTERLGATGMKTTTMSNKDVKTVVDRWACLKAIHVPHIDAEIELLIGNDAPEVLEPKEIRESMDGWPSELCEM